MARKVRRSTANTDYEISKFSVDFIAKYRNGAKNLQKL